MNSIRQTGKVALTDERVALLNAQAWSDSATHHECSLHQLSPYVGKLKSTIAKHVLLTLSEPGQTIYDPFCGSGVVPLESLILGRKCIANDLSPYAVLLTKAKLTAPPSLNEAISRMSALALAAEKVVPPEKIPDWVKSFFHPDTLNDVYRYCAAAKALDEPFFLACLMGILHHQRPGFLSYPSSHVTPYLRTNKFPPSEYSEMYEYRSVLPRLAAKVARAYKRPPAVTWGKKDFKLHTGDARGVSLPPNSVDMILTSPPYYKALDYARDNRLRLHFLDVDHKPLEDQMIAKPATYLADSSAAIQSMLPSLKSGGYLTLIVGDVDGRGVFRRRASDFAKSMIEGANGELSLLRILSDEIPSERRSRRHEGVTKVEHVIVLQKQ